MLRTYLCCCKSPGRAQDGREPGPCWLLSSSCENHQALPVLISESPKASCNNRRETRLRNPHPHRLGEQVRGKQKYGGEEGEGYRGGCRGERKISHCTLPFPTVKETLTQTSLYHQDINGMHFRFPISRFFWGAFFRFLFYFILPGPLQCIHSFSYNNVSGRIEIFISEKHLPTEL